MKKRVKKQKENKISRMVNCLDDSNIMEEREELMVSLVDEQVKPIFRIAHFFKPTISSTKKLPFLPSRSKLSSCSSLKVQFRGGPSYMRGWSKWVSELKPLHQEVWKKAGVFEAIIASTFKIYRHNDLILALAERWCIETNTFVFPWGEATVSLEDIVVLGGFSVLGHCVLEPVKAKDSVEVGKTLCEAHKFIRARKMSVGHRAWMEHFAGRGDIWSIYQVVDRGLFPVAICLSQGIPIALSPAALASIYRDLSLLKQLIVSSSKNAEKGNNSRCIENDSDLILRAPLHFVQLWAWERFTNLQPKPNVVYSGEPRVARWHKVQKIKNVDPRSEIDSASERFLWRPYAVDIVKNWDTNKFYKDRDEYVVVGQKMGSEILIFARLVRPSELVGMDCVEQYNPHRVSMQFGFDQDVPGCVNHASNHTPEIAWTNYNRPIIDAKLYIPSRFIDSDVSRRYFEWWKNQNVAPADAVQRAKCDEVREDGNIPDCEMRVLESSDDDDNIPIAESLRRRTLMKKEITIPSNQSQSSLASNNGTVREWESLPESKLISEKVDASIGKLDGDGPYVVKEMVPLERKTNNDKGSCKLNLPDRIEHACDGPNAEFLSTSPAKTLQKRKASAEAPKVTATCTSTTDGNINKHEKGSRQFGMIDIHKLEMRIRNFENINSKI
ncbi:hypothetical protein P3S68_005249 [Capsicum galapagoense]